MSEFVCQGPKKTLDSLELKLQVTVTDLGAGNWTQDLSNNLFKGTSHFVF